MTSPGLCLRVSLDDSQCSNMIGKPRNVSISKLIR
jgi:hypothetical protein